MDAAEMESKMSRSLAWRGGNFFLFVASEKHVKLLIPLSRLKNLLHSLYVYEFNIPGKLFIVLD